MLFYVFLLFMYLPNMVFLMISWVRIPNHIPKSGIWFASHSYGLEIMLLVFAVIYAKTFLELTRITLRFRSSCEVTFTSKRSLEGHQQKKKALARNS